MLLLNNDDVERCLDMRETLDALTSLYLEAAEDESVSVPRADLHMPTSGETRGLMSAHYLKTMSGGVCHAGMVALRLTSDIVTWRQTGRGIRRVKEPALPGNRWLGLVLLFSSENGELVAVMHDGVIQRMRVGATNGLATQRLAREDAEIVGLIGSGWQAGTQLWALSEVRDLKEVRVWSPTPEHRQAFAREWRERLDLNIRAVEHVHEAVEGADILATATNSRTPFVQPEWLAPGMHLSTMQRDEATDEALKRCDPLFVHTHATEHNYGSSALKSPEGLTLRDHPLERHIDWKSLPTLAGLIAGKHPGRTQENQITGFVNLLGLGAQFAAVGAKVLENARKQGLGRDLPVDWFLENVHP